MSDVEKELRDMLRTKADDVLIDTDIPGKTLRRSHRRRALNATLAGVVGVAVLVGGFFGSKALFLTGNHQNPRPATQPPAAEWRGLFPQDNRADAEAAQDAADRGDASATWQLDRTQVAKRYGDVTYGWGALSSITSESLDLESYQPTRIEISNCNLKGDTPADGVCQTTTITVEQLLTTGATGIWFVTEDDGAVHAPPGSPSDESLAIDAASAFMNARVAGTGAEPFLTEDSKSMYDTHLGGLYLYDGDVAGGEPQTNYASYFVVSTTAHAGTGFDVRVQISHGTFEGVESSHDEILWIASGLGLDNGQHLVVRSAERIDPPAPSPSASGAPGPQVHCFEGSKTPVHDCANAFMHTRLDGAGAEFYITAEGKATYDDPNNDLHLYGNPYADSGNLRLDSYEILTIRKVDANSYEVDVRLHATGEGGPVSIFETLFVGPGTTTNGRNQDWTIRGATGHVE